MAIPVNQLPPAVPFAAGAAQNGGNPNKDKPLLEQAEDLLVRAQKTMRGMRKELEVLRLKAEAYEYLKSTIDMHKHIMQPHAFAAAEPAAEAEIEYFIRSVQEKRLQGLLEGDAAKV